MPRGSAPSEATGQTAGVANTVSHSDAQAKDLLRQRWKEVTGRDVGLPSSFPGSRWVRALPAPAAAGQIGSSAALIKVGETTVRNPDGLYFVVGTSGGQQVADVVGIEVCGSWQNFETKRHTYTDRSLSLRLRADWLVQTRTISLQTRPFWQWAGFTADPTQPGQQAVSINVRWLSALYVLAPGDYEKARDELLPYANEYFCRHSSLGSWDSQAFKSFLRNLTWSDRFDRTFYNKR